MYGFYIQNSRIVENKDKSGFENTEQIHYKSFSFRYLKFDKFIEDKIFTQTKKFVLGIDGVILNKKSLLKEYAKKDFSDLILRLYEKEKIDFVSKIKGVFSGFIYEKDSDVLYFYNDKTATKQVFYSQYKNSLIIAPTLESIVRLRNNQGVNNNLDIQATYNLLTFGGMIENQTLIEDVFKLGAGEYLKFNDNKLEVNRYFDFNQVEISITSKKTAINRLNVTFIEALKLEYEKDKEYNYKHIATLSGGLDSRMNVMLAKKMDYKSLTYCFSQSNYADEKIARKIAKDLNLDFKFIPLDDGDYLINLSEMIGINSGLQFYHGSAHYNYALQQLDLSNYGLMHTGQIGDGILGGFVSNVGNKNYLLKTISNRFIEKVNIDKSVLDSYSNEEVFKLYQRVFNLANFGSYVVEHNKTYLVSPFLDDDVIKVALSIHPSLKINQNIYIDWINQLHPEIMKYKWERTGFRPDKKWKTALSRYTNKLKKEYFIFTNQQDKLSMNPLAYWYATNNTIKEFYSRSFNENIGLLEANKELFTDVTLMFKEGNFTEKAVVLTLLEVIKKYRLRV